MATWRRPFSFWCDIIAERREAGHRSRTMRGHVLVVLTAILTAGAGLSQTDEWRRRMDEGATAEIVGDYAKGIASYRLAAQIAEGFDRGDKRRVTTWNALANMYDALGQFVDAEAEYRRALKAAAEAGGKSSPEYALVLGNLGTSYVETGRPASGEKLMREALAIYSAADPPDPLRLAIARNALGEVLSVTGKFKEADTLFTAALPVLEKNPDAWGEAAIATNNLGVARFNLGKHEEAGQLLHQALSMMELHTGPDHPMLARTLNNLASQQARTGHPEEAGKCLRRALDIAERRLGPDHPVYAAILANYAALLREGGEKSQAKALKARSEQILKDSSRRNGIGASIDIHSLRSK
jgi:tetratricopeptide (TPR) repeat protein